MRRLPYEAGCVFAIAAIACCAYALHEGQDANWDQLNYHFYDVFALFHDRSRHDIAAAQTQTWLNPFGEIIQYFLIMLPPRIATVGLAALASLSIPLIYLIAAESLDRSKAPAEVPHLTICALAASSALVAPIFLSEIGTTFDDYLSSICVFLCLLFVISGRFSASSYVFAGLALGFAVDIKLTNAIYVFGWIAAIVAVERRKFFRPLLTSGIAALATYIPIGGAWLWHIYALLKNPIFPFYNNLFKSPAYAPVTMFDRRFRPGYFAAALGDFPKWALGLHPTAEVAFRDTRFLLVLGLLMLALPQLIRLLMRPVESRVSHPFDGRASAFLLVFAIVAFVTWLSFYGIHRYAVPLEQLAGLIILILLALLIGAGARFQSAAVMSVAAIVLTTVPADWGHATFKGSWFDIDVPARLAKPDVLYVMISDESLAYVIAAFPPVDSFVRIDGNLPLSPQSGLGKRALAMIASHQGEIRSLSLANYPLQSALPVLARFGLAPTSGGCLDFSSKARQLRSCPLARIKP